MTFLSLKNDVNVASKSNGQKNFEKNIIFICRLEVTDENKRSRILSRIRIQIRIRIRPGFLPKCHGSATPIFAFFSNQDFSVKFLLIFDKKK